jgi:hypothetical protein
VLINAIGILHRRCKNAEANLARLPGSASLLRVGTSVLLGLAADMIREDCAMNSLVLRIRAADRNERLRMSRHEKIGLLDEPRICHDIQTLGSDPYGFRIQGAYIAAAHEENIESRVIHSRGFFLQDCVCSTRIVDSELLSMAQLD